MTKKQRFADIKRRSKMAQVEAGRHERILAAYLNSPTVKRLKANVQKANDKINQLVGEWNDVVMDGHVAPPPDEPDTYTSVNGELLRNHREDPKSW